MPVPTPINLNDSTPPAPPGGELVHWLADANNPRNVSAWTRAIGGAVVKTAGYTAVADDKGKLLSFNSLTPATLTLPSPPPTGTWCVFVQNIGTGLLSVSPNGLTIDTNAAALPLAKNQGLYITTDGSNYFTEGSAFGEGGALLFTTSQAPGQEVTGKLLVFHSATALTLTLPGTPPSGTWAIFVQNLGAGALTLNPNGKQINLSTASLVLRANQGLYLTTDGTNYFTEGSVLGEPYHVVFQYVGKPAAGAIVGIFTMPADLDPTGVVFDAFFPAARGTCGTNPTATASYTIKLTRAGVTSSFTGIAIDTAGNFVFSGGANNLIGGDRLVAYAPNPADATLEDVAWTLAGRR